MPRTEEDKLFRTPIKVTLGSKSYEVRPLVIKDARIWRAKFAAVLGRLPEYTSATTDDPAKFQAGVTGMVVSMPDDMASLFFEYAKELPRGQIEAEATELELAEAIKGVMAIAFPLVGSITTALGQMAR